MGDVELILSHPVDLAVDWIGSEDLMGQLQACWLVVEAGDVPLCPRIVGRPGVGKTTLAAAAARRLGKPLYIHQCTMDTRPEDLVVTPVLSRGGAVRYHASPVVTAMIEGAVVVLDEANRMSEKSWASLAPLLDHRRYVESIVAGVQVAAHEDFRCTVTMNDDASTYEVPDYIMSRIQPMIEVGFPEREEELQILKYHVNFAPEVLLGLTVDFLQGGHQNDLDYSTRDGTHILRFALKLRASQPERPLEDVFDQAVRQVLGPDAFEFEQKRLEKNLHQFQILDGFQDFFTNEEDLLGGEGELPDEDD